MEQIQLFQLQENVRAIIAAEQSWLGCMTDTGKIVGDLVAPVESLEAWEVLSQ